MSNNDQTESDLNAKWENIDKRLDQLAEDIELIVKKMENVENITHQMFVSILQAFEEGKTDGKRKP